MKSGAILITEKRDKHLSMGFNYDHDTEHTPMQFINSAKAYMYADIYSWPFDKESFKTGTQIENLINAGAMIATAIDRLQRYEVDKVYVLKTNNQSGTFKVIKVQMLNSGTVLVNFVGLSGDLRPEKQKFMLGSLFDIGSTPNEKTAQF